MCLMKCLHLFIAVVLVFQLFNILGPATAIALRWHPKLLQKEPLLQQKDISYNGEINVVDYGTIVDAIVECSVNGSGKHQSYKRLANFTDKFSNRIAGSKNLENSIDYMLQKLKDEGFENVHGEPVSINPWIRNEEFAYMLTPRKQKLAILGLGTSVATPKNGITAQVLVVKSFDDLKSKAHVAVGKIIVFNQDYISYSDTAQYRTHGACEAAKVGALAALIRSVTPLSIYSPHTGIQFYCTGVTKIPVASLTVEDAEMLQRMQDRGENITIQLVMNCENPEKPVESRNIIAEILGYANPEQVILFGGHIDSWDVGKGAMDDGGGAFVSWQVLSLIKQLGLRPRRTLRLILWTGEEYGGIGGQAYYNAHKHEKDNFKFVMESDMGTFKPNGIIYFGNVTAGDTVKQIIQMLAPINVTNFVITTDPGQIGEDVMQWLSDGVPGASLLTNNEKYFYYHHSDGDTMTVQDPYEMDLCAAVWASLAYVMADV